MRNSLENLKVRHALTVTNNTQTHKHTMKTTKKSLAQFLPVAIRNPQTVTGGAAKSGYWPKHPGNSTGNDHPQHPGYDKDR